MRQSTVKIGALVASLLLLSASYLVLVAADNTAGNEYMIQTSGTPGLTITGTCTVATASGPVIKDFTGPVDHVEHVTGTGVSCHLYKAQQDGTLKLIISQGGNVVSESVSSGGTSVVDASVSVT